MEHCPECKSTDIVEMSTDDEGSTERVCRACGLVVEDDPTNKRILNNFNLSEREWKRSGSPYGRTLKGDIGLSPSSHVYIAEKLKLPEAAEYLRKSCRECGKKLEKGAKIDLCPEHYAEHVRAYERDRMRRKRAKGKSVRSSSE